MALRKDKIHKNKRSATPPMRFIPLEAEFNYAGMRLKCVARGPHERGRACMGCALRASFCDTLQCSRSDRQDGTSVWFVNINQ